MAIELSKGERQELEKRLRSQSGCADHARRTRCILMPADGETWATIREAIACNDSYISRWSKRFEAERLAGLYSRHCGQPAQTLTPRVEARILEATHKPPHDGTTHWSTRKLAKKLGVSHMIFARMWKKHGMKPHRLERYMTSNDPVVLNITATEHCLCTRPSIPRPVRCWVRRPSAIPQRSSLLFYQTLLPTSARAGRSM